MNKVRKHILILIGSFLMLALVFNACKKEVNKVLPETPKNPFDDVDYGNNPNEIPIDSSTYLGLHKFIFIKKCAVPACHDGAFEPDFRTIEGSYNNLVNHPVVKNDSASTFTYRVIPGDTALSWLHERVTTDDPVLGKMPLYDVMSDHEIKQIENWILDGAKNIYGVTPSLPNLQPSMGGVLAYLNDTSGIRYDTVRTNDIDPIQLPDSSTIELWFLLYDTDENGDFLPGSGFTQNEIKISDNPFDFTGSTPDNLTVQSPLSPAFLPIPFGVPGVAPYYHSYSINTANYVKGRTYYFRVYVQDADHTFATEIPENGSQVYLMTYFAFIVQ